LDGLDIRSGEDAQAAVLANVLASPACALFVARVQAMQPVFQVSADNAPQIAAICQRLDGLPLAIELAAVQTRLLSPSALLARLGRRLDLLTGGARDAPDRQRTLRATIAWSERLLAPAQRRLFRWLAVFAGGAAVEAVEAILRPRDALDVADSDDAVDSAGTARSTDSTGLDADAILAGVRALIEHHLARQEEQSDGEPRLFLLQTIREYGLERLAQTGELAAAQTAHAAYYLALAEAAAPQLRGSTEREHVWWLARLDREQENLLGALRFLLGFRLKLTPLSLAATSSQAAALLSARPVESAQPLKQVEQIEQVEQALRLCVALYRYWQDRGWGYVRAGQASLTQALARSEGVTPHLRARALRAATGLAVRMEEYEVVEALGGESLTLARQLGDAAGVAAALDALGYVARNRGQYALAGAQFEEALGLRAQLGERYLQVSCQFELASLATEQGQYERARALLEDNQRLSQAVGDQMNAHWVDYHLARALYLQYQGQTPLADLADAQRLAERSLAFFQEQGYTWHRAAALTLLARLRLAQGVVGVGGVASATCVDAVDEVDAGAVA
jgi:hypothetical protein